MPESGASHSPSLPATELAALLDLSEEGTLLLDDGGRIAFANAVAGRILGQPVEALCERAVAEVLGDPAIAARVSAAMHFVRTSGAPSTRFRVTTEARGEEAWEVAAIGTALALVIRPPRAAACVEEPRAAPRVPPPATPVTVPDLAFGPLADEVPVGVFLCDAHGLA